MMCYIFLTREMSHDHDNDYNEDEIILHNNSGHCNCLRCYECQCCVDSAFISSFATASQRTALSWIWGSKNVSPGIYCVYFNISHVGRPLSPIIEWKSEQSSCILTKWLSLYLNHLWISSNTDVYYKRVFSKIFKRYYVNT